MAALLLSSQNRANQMQMILIVFVKFHSFDCMLICEEVVPSGSKFIVNFSTNTKNNKHLELPSPRRENLKHIIYLKVAQNVMKNKSGDIVIVCYENLATGRGSKFKLVEIKNLKERINCHIQ